MWIKSSSLALSLAIAFITSFLSKIPHGISISLAGTLIVTLLLVYIVSWIISLSSVLKDFPLGSSFIQYSFVAISAVYLGDSYGDALRLRQDLNIPSLGAALFVGVFTLASITEGRIPPAKNDDLPAIARKIARIRVGDVLLSTFISIIFPFVIGAYFSNFL